MLSSLGGLKSIGNGLKGIAGGLKEMGKGIKNVVKNGIEITHKNKDSLGNTLLKIAAAIGVLVASIYVLSKMETEDVAKGLGVISIIAAELLAVSFLFGKIGADGKSFLMVAAALTLLVIPIKLLGSMDTEQALKGILAIGVIMAELALFMRMAGKGFTGKTGFFGLTIAINLMVLAVKNMAKLDTGSMVKSLIGMAVYTLTRLFRTDGLFKVLSEYTERDRGFGSGSRLGYDIYRYSLALADLKYIGSRSAREGISRKVDVGRVFRHTVIQL